MNQLGLGVMIRELAGDGGESKEAYEALVNQLILAVALDENTIRLSLGNGSFVLITDQGQSCCENRYITTDDDLGWFNGSLFIDMELGEWRDLADNGESHEVQFLNLKTSKGVITFETHNEHNGYYGGFSVGLKLIPPQHVAV